MTAAIEKELSLLRAEVERLMGRVDRLETPSRRMIACDGRTGPDGRCQSCGMRIGSSAGSHYREVAC